MLLKSSPNPWKILRKKLIFSKVTKLQSWNFSKNELCQQFFKRFFFNLKVSNCVYPRNTPQCCRFDSGSKSEVFVKTVVPKIQTILRIMSTVKSFLLKMQTSWYLFTKAGFQRRHFLTISETILFVSVIPGTPTESFCHMEMIPRRIL